MPQPKAVRFQIHRLLSYPDRMFQGAVHAPHLHPQFSNPFFEFPNPGFQLGPSPLLLNDSRLVGFDLGLEVGDERGSGLVGGVDAELVL
jgi:hypothetical protein